VQEAADHWRLWLKRGKGRVKASEDFCDSLNPFSSLERKKIHYEPTYGSHRIKISALGRNIIIFLR
jgi:hypothetical protein